MRWISTPESVEKNEPTVLAIAETVLAVLVTVSLCITTALNYPALQAEIQASLSDAPKFLQLSPRVLDLLEHASLPYLWAFNLFDLAPWQWLNLLGAVLTGGLLTGWLAPLDWLYGRYL